MATDLNAKIRTFLEAQTDDFNHCEGCEYDCRCQNCPEVLTILLAVLDLHPADAHECPERDERGNSYTAWQRTCPTLLKIAKKLGIEVADD